MTDTIYFKKVGRKYVPAFHGVNSWDFDGDLLKIGQSRLTVVSGASLKRYQYDITPDFAPLSAALSVTRQAIEEAVRESFKSIPSGGAKKYTRKQLKIIEQFKNDMGGMYPMWWDTTDPRRIADAAMSALEQAVKKGVGVK